MKKGFTLIELLVVITILAILAGAALPYVQNYVSESRQAKAKSDLEEISRALVVYETREGEYNKADVSDLTGRYLNKSPIDPWGSPYIVATESGIVYSKGPDRKNTNEVDQYDNISVGYQPPLSLVSVKWVDKNQSGAVDIQNVPDELHLTFSRKLKKSTLDDLTGVAAKILMYDGDDHTVSTPMKDFIDDAAGESFAVASKTLIYKLVSNNVFVAGHNSLLVTDSHGIIYDLSTPRETACLSNQAVVILAQ